MGAHTRAGFRLARTRTGYIAGGGAPACIRLMPLRPPRIVVLLAMAALLVGAAAALAACASGSSDGGGGPKDKATPKPGGTFTFPLPGEPLSIEPLNAQDSSGLQVAHQVFQGLTRWVLHDDGVLATEPDIAESWESADAQTWIFHLKTGVTFQAPVGRPVTAQDFVDSWTRVTDPKNQSYVAYILAPLEGCDDRGYQTDPAQGLTGVKASTTRRCRSPCATPSPTSRRRSVTPSPRSRRWTTSTRSATRPTPRSLSAPVPTRSSRGGTTRRSAAKNAAYWDKERAG